MSKRFYAEQWEQEFWALVVKTDSCWLWTGSLSSEGYGFASRLSAKVWAHRHSYEVLVGPIPEGLVIDHLCRNPVCVNPAHLEPVTNAENVMRGVGFGASNAAKTTCPRGHEYDKHRSNGQRACSICDKKWDRDSKRAKNDAIRKEFGVELSPGFVEFWEAYRCKRRVKRLEAWSEWNKQGCEAIRDEVMEGLRKFKLSDQWASQYQPEPARWLKHQRWTDDPVEQDEAQVTDDWKPTGPPKADN